MLYTFVNRNESLTQRLHLDLKEFRPIQKFNFLSSKKTAKFCQIKLHVKYTKIFLFVAFRLEIN
jgi:hypothetical protein